MKHQSFFMRSASAMAVTAAFGAAALAAAPEAGSVIGNQAVATYTNQAGDTITVTSNTVETIVQQVAGVTLTSDNNETIAPVVKLSCRTSLPTKGTAQTSSH